MHATPRPVIRGHTAGWAGNTWWFMGCTWQCRRQATNQPRVISGISISLEQRFVVTLWHHGPRTKKNRQRTQVWNMDRELSHLLWHWLLILMFTCALHYATWMSKRNSNRTENNNLSTFAIILPPYMHCQHTGLYCTRTMLWQGRWFLLMLIHKDTARY